LDFSNDDEEGRRRRVCSVFCFDKIWSDEF
jgi:hypothetical protein